LRHLASHLFVSRAADHRDLHSFPTRRSSDLQRGPGVVSWRGLTGRLTVSSVLAVSPEGSSTSMDTLRPVTSTSAASPTASSGSSDRKSTRLNSSHVKISYAVFCLKKKKKYKA